MTDAEVAGLFNTAVHTAARKVGIEDVDLKGIDELLSEIGHVDAETHRLLVEFIEAYRKWYGFHLAIEQQGRSGRLDANEHAELAKNVEARNRTRTALIQRLRSLG